MRHAWVAERDGRRTLGRGKMDGERERRGETTELGEYGCILHLTFMSLRHVKRRKMRLKTERWVNSERSLKIELYYSTSEMMNKCMHYMLPIY